MLIAGAAQACSLSDGPPQAVPTMTSAPTAASSAPAPSLLVMPNVTGMRWGDVDRSLRSIGWSGTLVKGPDVNDERYPAGAVASQSPAPGEHLGTTAPITLHFVNPG
ncbi:PASTA domain-containing protein [Mycobacterium hackensackense]|uniref:PASTA domain-containing protein n=1 Tax=Mycobacterium hackensackense TaxID=228909 RepID=UPI003557E146